MPLLYSCQAGSWNSAESLQSLVVATGQTIRFDLASGGCWYGHGFAHRQPFPLNREVIANERFAVNNALSPVWMASSGTVIWALGDHVLSVRLGADNSGTLDITPQEQPAIFRFFHGPNLPAAHREFLKAIGWPSPFSNVAALRQPLFCTWTQFPKTINQQRVFDMAQAIPQQEYPASTLILDDHWEAVPGDLAFGAHFPDPKAMVDELHRLGFEVWLWISPFVNTDSANFAALAAQGFLVKQLGNEQPSLLHWWNGEAGLVDFTNPAAAQWYLRRLEALMKDCGVDGFKLDGGDAKYQPPAATSRFHAPIGASAYSDLFLKLVESLTPGRMETRTMWMSQGRNIIWRQGGKDSHWGVDNGLPAVLHLGLHMALLGYDLFMADMVPGRVQTLRADMPLPTDELMVRWTELSAFTPFLQFSYLPWNYAPATNAIVRQLAGVHAAVAEYLMPHIAGRTAPLLRPLFYDYPDIAQYYTIGDEFLLGPDLLVAPVMAAAQVARDVQVPPGTWVDAWTGRSYVGPQLLPLHPAPCPGLPLFVRASNSALLAALSPLLAALPRGSISPGTTTATYQAGLNRDIRVTG